MRCGLLNILMYNSDQTVALHVSFRFSSLVFHLYRRFLRYDTEQRYGLNKKKEHVNVRDGHSTVFIHCENGCLRCFVVCIRSHLG